MASFMFLLLSYFISSILATIVAIAAPQNNINFTDFTKLNFPRSVASSGSITFDFFGMGPYAGVQDGRILYFSKLTNSWKGFAYTSPNRTKAFCDGTVPYDRSPTCGLPTGLSLDYRTFKFYACDAYVGLTAVEFIGGAARTLVRDEDGNPAYRFPNSVDVASNGRVHFTDASELYGPSEVNKSIQTGDSTGRLLQYDPKTKQVTTLLSHLARAVGVSTDVNASFVLVSEAYKNRILRYWQDGRTEVLVTFQGSPNKIKRNEEGNFWVAITVTNDNGGITTQAAKFSPSGQILAAVDLSQEYQRRINTVIQQGDEILLSL